jgi:hypothetical protein
MVYFDFFLSFNISVSGAAFYIDIFSINHYL